MKQAIYYITQRILFGKKDTELIFSTTKFQEFALVKITFSSVFLSNPSPVMRMCCCSMS